MPGLAIQMGNASFRRNILQKVINTHAMAARNIASMEHLHHLAKTSLVSTMVATHVTRKLYKRSLITPCRLFAMVRMWISWIKKTVML